MDDQQRARELLAQQFEAEGFVLTAAETRAGKADVGTYVRAITAALRAAPEVGDSYVVLQRVDVKRLLASDENSPGYELSRKRVMGCLAARPQGVKG